MAFNISGFQPEDHNPQRGREPFLEGSRVDITCTQLYCICYIRVLDGGHGL